MNVREIKPTLEQVVGAFVSEPAAVKVVVDAEPPVLLAISCATQDYGLVLGTKAAMLLSLRLVAGALVAKCGLEAAEPVLELEPQPMRERQTYPPNRLRSDWTTDGLESLAHQTLCHCFEGKVQVEFEDFTATIIKARFLPETCPYGEPSQFAAAFETILNAASARQGGKKVRVAVNVAEVVK